jgi:3'(2'), 5'-bisphosphate nucleotidase
VSATDSEILNAIRDAAIAAGNEIMVVYNSDFDVRTKGDASPVTDADERAEAIILKALAQITPDIPVVAEESMSAGHNPGDLGDQFWLVDPLDGTREFVERNDEFTVNIALVRKGVPTLGVVYAPVLKRMYGASGPGDAWIEQDKDARTPITVRPAPEDGLTVVVSRHHMDQSTIDFLKDFKVKDQRPAGSSLKFCLVAEGVADLYPRYGPTCEWDTAAGDAVVRGAGGTVTNFHGEPLRYGNPPFKNPGFVVRGKT